MSAWVAEFGSAQGLLRAAAAARDAGLAGRCEASAPCAVPGLDEALGLAADGVPGWMLLGGLLGGGGTYLMQWYSAVLDYPLNIGGRPAASWPAFVPAAAEMCLLGAGLCGFLAFVLGGGLPRLRHPLFEARAARRLSSDRYLLLLREDAQGPAAAEAFLRELQPRSLERVED